MSDDEPTPVDIEIHRWCGLRVEGRVVDRRSDLTVAGRHRGIRGATADLRESEISAWCGADYRCEEPRQGVGKTRHGQN
jgi:hypothetical protein